MNTSRSRRQNTGRTNRSSLSAATQILISPIKPSRVHADEGYRVALEPAFQETIDPSNVDPTKKHVYVPGDAPRCN